MSKQRIAMGWIFAIIVALLAAIIIWGVKPDWSGSVFEIEGSGTPDLVADVAVAQQSISPSYYASVHFTPNTVCKGLDQTTGYIESNMPGASCSIYSDGISGEMVVLDATGKYQESFKSNTVGVMKSTVICLLNGKYAISNEATLTTNDCSANCDNLCIGAGGFQEGAPATGPGDCTGNTQYALLSGTGCCCVPTLTPDTTPTGDCVDSDNGLNILVAGTVQLNDGSGQLTAYDVCETLNSVAEKTCSADKTSWSSTVTSCAPGYYCFNGACMIGTAACTESCKAQYVYDWTSGGCFAPDINVDATVADTCVRNNGDWTSAYGCESGKVCCCR